MALLRVPSTNEYAVNKQNNAARWAVMRALADCGPLEALNAFELGHLVYGTLLSGAGSVHSAIGWGRTLGFIEKVAPANKSRVPRFRITEKGRAHLAAAEAFRSLIIGAAA